jgi:ribosomal protein L40E
VRPRVCRECGSRDVWEMEPDAGGTELICRSCGHTAVSPFRAIPSDFHPPPPSRAPLLAVAVAVGAVLLYPLVMLALR